MAAPEATYTADPSTSTRDLVRMLSGDTNREFEFFCSDSEIDYWITYRTLNGVARPYLSAADVLDTMAVRVAQRSDLRRVGDVQVADTRDSLVSKFEAQAEKRRAESITRDVGAATVTILSGGADDECNPRYFHVGQFLDRMWP